jgi:hypothetical protein
MHLSRSATFAAEGRYEVPPFHRFVFHSETRLRLQQSLSENLVHPYEEIQRRCVDAFRAFSSVYYPEYDEHVFNSIVQPYALNQPLSILNFSSSRLLSLMRSR